MKKYKFTYENSGVNINAADNFVKYIANLEDKKKSSNAREHFCTCISNQVDSWRKGGKKVDIPNGQLSYEILPNYCC